MYANDKRTSLLLRSCYKMKLREYYRQSDLCLKWIVWKNLKKVLMNNQQSRQFFTLFG